MQQNAQIIHVELSEPFNDKIHYYFGSVSAIYDVIPKDKIGVELRTVRKRLAENPEYHAPGAIVRRSILFRKQHSNK